MRAIAYRKGETRRRAGRAVQVDPVRARVGQISVVQLALAGAAGFTISHMAVNFGITFPVAALAGIAVAVVIGLITAVSAVRVRGVSLAVVTRESGELGACLRALADQGQSMLLIEHDMGLVLGICDRVVVLEFGEVIADGPPEVVRADPLVIAAYLGSGAVGTAVARVAFRPPASE